MSAIACVRRIDEDFFAVRAKSRVSIAATFATILRWQIKMAELYRLLSRNMIKIDGLFTLLVRIGIVENPFIAGQVSAVAVSCHYSFADDHRGRHHVVSHFDLFRAVLIEIERVAVRRVP